MLKVKLMSTKTNVKIHNLISFFVCILFRMVKRSVRTFDKYITEMFTVEIVIGNNITINVPRF